MEGNHEAIISPEKYDMVQREIAKRGRGKNYHSGVHQFSSKIRCEECGSWYGSKVWHSSDKSRRVIWQCNHKFDGDRRCNTPHLTDEQIQDVFLSAANKLLNTKDAVIANGKEMAALLFNTNEAGAERNRLLEEIDVISDAVWQNIFEKTHVALDQMAYQKKCDNLSARYDALKNCVDELNEPIRQTKAQKADTEDFLAVFEKISKEPTELSADVFNALIDFVTVYSAKDIRVTFRNGQEIEA